MLRYLMSDRGLTYVEKPVHLRTQAKSYISAIYDPNINNNAPGKGECLSNLFFFIIFKWFTSSVTLLEVEN